MSGLAPFTLPSLAELKDPVIGCGCSTEMWRVGTWNRNEEPQTIKHDTASPVRENEVSKQQKTRETLYGSACSDTQKRISSANKAEGLKGSTVCGTRLGTNRPPDVTDHLPVGSK